MGIRWLITGGCGFLGTSLIADLMAEGGHSGRISDNLSVGNREDLAKVCKFTETTGSSLLTTHSSPEEGTSVELIVGDILDESLALEVVRDMDVIVHLAANTGVGPSVENPRLDCVTNIIGTLNYLEAARHNKAKRFVFASSGAPLVNAPPLSMKSSQPILYHPMAPANLPVRGIAQPISALSTSRPWLFVSAMSMAPYRATKTAPSPSSSARP